MKNVAKFAVAFGFALSGAVPAFAAHTPKTSEPAQHVRTERVHPHGAMDARAYAPSDTKIEFGPDFGIGSQR